MTPVYRIRGFTGKRLISPWILDGLEGFSNQRSRTQFTLRCGPTAQIRVKTSAILVSVWLVRIVVCSA